MGTLASDPKWVYDSPVHSEVEAKLRRFLVELGNAGKIIGVQVCAYKDGKVIIDTAAGVLGKDDPRPVQPDSLFPVLSGVKGVTAGMVHWLADRGKLKLDDYVANIWPEFGQNGKDQIKVNQVLNHTAGLQNALAGFTDKLVADFDECLKRVAVAKPETEPGVELLYHYATYGWLCGGIIERASGKKFLEILEEAFVRPLNIEGELYMGNIPPGAQSRVATVTIEPDDLNMLVPILIMIFSSPATQFMPTSFNYVTVKGIIQFCNEPNVQRAVVPGVNGLISARALTRFYAALVDGGVVPPPHPSCPPTSDDIIGTKMFTNPKEKILDAFIASGDYKDLTPPGGRFGLGFMRVDTKDGSVFGFGHPALGGSNGYADINNRFALSVNINKLSAGIATGEIIRFICLELALPVPKDYAG